MLLPHGGRRAVQPGARLRLAGLGAPGQRAGLRHLDHPGRRQGDAVRGPGSAGGGPLHPGAARDPGRGAGGRPGGLPDDERLRARHGRQARHRRLVAGDHPDREPATRVVRAHGSGAGGVDGAAEGAAAHLPRRHRVGDDPGHRSRHRARGQLHAAGGRRERAHQPRAAGDAAAVRAQGSRSAHTRHQRPPSQQPPLRPPVAERRGRHRPWGVPAVATPVRAGGARRFGRGHGRDPPPHRLGVGLRPRHRIRRDRLARAQPHRRALRATRRLALISGLVLAAGAARAAQPQFWRIEGARDFLDGTTDGLSVDSEGRVRLAPVTRPVYDPEIPFVWCLARDAKGVLYAGTGNDGKVFKVEGGKGSLFFDATELEVHALAIGPDGRLYVGTSPDGKVYAVDAAGKAQTFYDPTDKYIWALAFDHSGNLLVATGGDGKIHRV
ncbi:MAG: hypothetical protein DMF80_00330, partial [Acidobacteria bacterium]